MLSAQEKARFAWHCRRGMLELDLILQRFLEQHLNKLSKEQLQAFDLLLECTDPELFAWFMGNEEPQDAKLQQIVTIIRTGC